MSLVKGTARGVKEYCPFRFVEPTHTTFPFLASQNLTFDLSLPNSTSSIEMSDSVPSTSQAVSQEVQECVCVVCVCVCVCGSEIFFLLSVVCFHKSTKFCVCRVFFFDLSFLDNLVVCLHHFRAEGDALQQVVSFLFGVVCRFELLGDEWTFLLMFLPSLGYVLDVDSTFAEVAWKHININLVSWWTYTWDGEYLAEVMRDGDGSSLRRPS